MSVTWNCILPLSDTDKVPKQTLAVDLLTISNSQKMGRVGRVGRAAPSFLYGGSHHNGEVTVTIPTLLDWKAVRSPPPLLPVRITDVRLSPKVCWHQERKFEWPENPCSYLKRKECNCNFLFIRDMNVYVIHTSVFFLKGQIHDKARVRSWLSLIFLNQ